MTLPGGSARRCARRRWVGKDRLPARQHGHQRRDLLLVRLPSGALVIDTPGLRELQFWEGDLGAAFTTVLAVALTMALSLGRIGAQNAE